MNIFILDNDPETAARHQCDKHVVKMVLESAQLMATALRECGATDDQLPLTKSGTPYRSTHVNHPCSIWARETKTNYAWLAFHAIALCDEYTKRYGKTHSCESAIHHMADMFDMIPDGPQTQYAQAMPDYCRCEGDAVTAYRDYYWCEKKRFAKWEKNTAAPEWWIEAEIEECAA